MPPKTRSLADEGYRAALDRADAGIVAGWACKLGDHTPLSVEIWAGTQKVAEGVADGLRPDLKEHGLNDGYHAFWLPLDDLEPGNTADYIVLKDKTTGEALPAGKLPFNPAQLEGHLKASGDASLKLTIHSDTDISQPVVLYKDHLLVLEAPLPPANQDGSYSIDMPYWMADIGAMDLRIGLQGYAYAIDRLVLENSSDEGRTFFSQLGEDKPSGQHLFSLHQQYERLGDTVAPEKLAHLGLLYYMLQQPIPETDAASATFQKRPFALPQVDSPLVSIIIPAYGKSALSYRAIASIALAPTDISYEVILADDCSPDDTATLADLIDNLRYVRPPENLRFLRNCNYAAQQAHGDYLVFLNNDTEVCAYWLDALLAPFANADVGVTGGKLLDIAGRIQDAGGIVWADGNAWNVGRGAPFDTPQFNYVRESDYVSGAMFCTRTDLWQQLGGFSEALAPCYFEDTDFCFKARAAGKRVVYTPFANAFHMEGASHGTDITAGLKRYQVVNQQHFFERWQNQLRSELADGKAAVRAAQDRGICGRILMIDDQVPNPANNAGAYAALEEMKMMQALGYKITFIAKHISTRSAHVQRLQHLGAEAIYAPYCQDYRDFIKQHISEFDAIYITRYQIAEDVLPLLSDYSHKPVLFNNADLHFLREIRSAELSPHDTAKMAEALETKARELAICQHVTRVLCYTEAEKAVLIENGIAADKISITPWVLPERDTGPDYNAREGIAFLGGFNHFPNGEAVDYLINTLMPALAKARQDITLYIYGSNMPAYADLPNNIRAIGFAENLADVFHQHRLFVAPLLSGAGIKGKVLESLSFGTPTVLSTIAAEGIGLAHNTSALIVDETDAWVSAIIRAYDDTNLWQKLRTEGLKLAKTHYSAEGGIERMREIFESVLA